MVMEFIDEVIATLHSPPCPNKKVMTKSVDNFIDIFWKDFKIFRVLTITNLDGLMMIYSLKDPHLA